MTSPPAHTLRFRLNAAILGVVLVITGVFALILLPVGRAQVDASRRQGEVLMATVAASNTERLANEVFEDRMEAVKLRVLGMTGLSGLGMAGVYNSDGLLLQSAGLGVDESLPATLLESVGRGPVVWEQDTESGTMLMQVSRIQAMGTQVGWLVLGHSLEGARQARTDTLFIFAGLLGTILVTLMVLFNAVLQRAIIQPIERLGRTMQTIAAGDMDSRVEETGAGEIGRLGASFNSMADRIQEQQQSLSRAEERYRGIFENAVEGIFQVDAEGRFLHVNPAMARILGCASTTELEQSGPGRARDIVARQEDRRRIMDLLRDHGEIHGYEVLLRRVDAGVFWGQVSLRVLQGEEAGARYEGSLTDITLRKDKERAEEERTAAQAASREKSAFLARMSHEIRTPLNAILGMSELLSETSLDKEQSGFVDTLTMSGELLLSLIDDILDFSRAESGRLALEAIPFDPSALAGEVCRLLEPRAGEKGLLVQCETDGDLPERVVGDPTRLRQVLINLVGNAIKFTEQGRVLLDVRPEPLPMAPHRLCFTVCDTGIGISVDQQAVVFESFTQADTSTTRRYGGTGLGLAISKSLVELMGGSLELDSEPDRGSTFTFCLDMPRSLRERDATGRAEPKAVRSPYRGLARVLVVDDLPLNREVVRRFLKAAPVLLDEAADGREAVDMALPGVYDLVLMDLEMPILDGLQATRLIRAREGRTRSPLPVVALTGHALASQRKECLAVGCTAFLSKPVRKKDLLRVVGELVPSLVPGHGPVDWGYLLDLVGGEHEDMAALRPLRALPAPGGDGRHARGH